MLGFLSGPGILFILPYLIDKKTYASIASVFVISQSVILLGALGAETYAAKNNIKISKVLINSFFLSLVVSGMAVVVFKEFSFNIWLPVFLYALSNVYSLIVQQYLVYNGEHRRYAIFGLLKAVIFILVIYVAIFLSLDVTLFIGVAAFFSVSVATFFLIKYFNLKDSVDQNMATLLKNSIPYFFINFSAVAPMLADRLVAKNIFQEDDFVKYMIISVWAVPFIYICNIVEKYYMALDFVKYIKIHLNILVLGVFYILIIYLLIYEIKIIKIPFFDNLDEFIIYYCITMGWILCYSSISFPMAVYFQKMKSIKNINYISIFSAVGFLVLGVFAFFIAKSINSDNWIMLFVFSYIASIGAAFCKLFSIYFMSKKS